MKGRSCFFVFTIVFVLQSLAALCQETASNPIPVEEAQNSWKLAAEQATSADMISVPEGFAIDLVRSAGPEEGSWIAIEFNDRNQLFVSKEEQGILRFDLEENGDLTHPKLVNDELEQCRGLLWAHGYLFANSNNRMPPPMEVKENADGLFRLEDKDGDGVFETSVKLIETSQGSPGHGRNQLKLGTDGLIYFISGYDVVLSNRVDPSSFLKNYAEDQLIPNPWDDEWFNKHGRAPGGHLFRTDKDGSFFQLVAGGLRNPMDVAFNREGEIFTYDADMEWDAALPWYRPTRVIHLVSGADYGWRRATGKLPTYYEDSLPAAIDIGLGSPTGLEFGYHSNFPGKWKEALFTGDWTYGRILAVHLDESGASYTGSFETFAGGRPMNVVDLTFGPDGNLYFVTGGMKTKSGIYRIRWIGDDRMATETESAATTSPYSPEALLRNLRYQLEFFQVIRSDKGAQLALTYIDHPDRFVRHAARIALENQDPENWVSQALAGTAPAAMVALARGGETLLPRGQLVRRLNRIRLDGVRDQRKLLGFLRAYQLEFGRNGAPDGTDRSDAIINLSNIFPHSSPVVNHELTELLVFLEAPQVLKELTRMIEESKTTEDLSQYLVYSRYLEDGWNVASKRTFLKGVQRLEAFPGGKFHQKIVDYLRNEMLEKLSEAETTALTKWIEPIKPEPGEDDESAEPVSFVQAWEVDDFNDYFAAPLKGRSFESGKKAYTRANCVLCHKMEGNAASQKGIEGPDLTHVGGRFGLRDLLVSIIHPSRAINDKYRNPAAPNLSTMPPGQINVLTSDEVVDLLAYLQAGGKDGDPVFSGEPLKIVESRDTAPSIASVVETETANRITPAPAEETVGVAPHYFEHLNAANHDDRGRVFAEMNAILEEFPEATFELVGYADDSPHRSTNQEISENRARFTALNMIYRGIPREAITYRGAGALSDSPDGSKKVEVIVEIGNQD